MTLESEFRWAAKQGNLDVVKSCLAQGVAINAADESGSALNYAVLYNYYGVAIFLLSNGADPNITSVNKWAPLHAAAAENNGAMISLLRRYNADIGQKNGNGLTPYELAFSKNNFLAMQALLPDYKGKLWQKQGDDEISNVRYLPGIAQKRTEVFSFRERVWTLTTQNTLSQHESTVVRFFDEMSDKFMIKEAIAKFRELGGEVSDDVLEPRNSRNKQPLTPAKTPKP